MRLTLCLLTLLPLPALADDKLTVMLDWFVNPDHGPIIVAQTRGYFTDAGLTVAILAPADPSDPPKMVAAGQADLAVSYQPQLYLQHAEGLPLLRVGTLIEGPLTCLMVDAAGPVQDLADLRGRKIGYALPGFQEVLLQTMLAEAGVEPHEVTAINVNFALTSAVAAGQVDAVVGAFRNFELHQMQAIGREGRCFLPEDHGVPPYDELIYLANPATMDKGKIDRFLQATARAAREIAADPKAGWQDFLSYSHDLDDNLNRAAWGDTVAHFAPDPAQLDTAQYAAFGAFLAQAGLIPKAPPVAEIARGSK